MERIAKNTSARRQADLLEAEPRVRPEAEIREGDCGTVDPAGRGIAGLAAHASNSGRYMAFGSEPLLLDSTGRLPLRRPAKGEGRAIYGVGQPAALFVRAPVATGRAGTPVGVQA